MPDLIPLHNQPINAEVQQTVNARELHEFLGSKKTFGSWILARIKRYKFVEHVDFVPLTRTGKNPNGGRPSVEYFLTIDMAKELSMVENTDRGREARQYFLECERLVKQSGTLPPPMTQVQLIAAQAQALVEMERRQVATEAEVAAVKAQAESAVVKADLALAESRTMSLEEFVIGQHLLHQFPLATWATLGKQLMAYCAAYNIVVQELTAPPGRNWKTERVYPLHVFGWLLRQPKRYQVALLPLADRSIT